MHVANIYVLAGVSLISSLVNSDGVWGTSGYKGLCNQYFNPHGEDVGARGQGLVILDKYLAYTLEIPQDTVVILADGLDSGLDKILETLSAALVTINHGAVSPTEIDGVLGVLSRMPYDANVSAFLGGEQNFYQSPNKTLPTNEVISLLIKLSQVKCRYYGCRYSRDIKVQAVNDNRQYLQVEQVGSSFQNILRGLVGGLGNWLDEYLEYAGEAEIRLGALRPKDWIALLKIFSVLPDNDTVTGLLVGKEDCSESRYGKLPKTEVLSTLFKLTKYKCAKGECEQCRNCRQS